MHYEYAVQAGPTVLLYKATQNCRALKTFEQTGGEKHTLNPEEVGHISAHVTMRCAQVEIVVCFTLV